MSAARWLSGAVVAAGAVLGSLIDTERAPAPPMAGGYHVVAADLHVHAFPGDGALPPWELAREAARRGLQAIVVSNHNQTGIVEPGSIFPVQPGVLVIPAQEVTTPRFHLIAAGIRETVDWRLPEDEIVRAIHAQGGVVIAAHPTERSWRGSDALLAAVDGIEVAHPLTDTLDTGRAELDALHARARRVNPDVAPIGSSDFHMVAPLGASRTYVFAESATAEGVLDAIRAGRTVAEDRQGARYGDASLVARLDDAGIESREATPTLALGLGLVVLLGLAGAVVKQ